MSTIKRELSRNSGKKGYRPQQAHRFAQKRHPLKRKVIEEMRAHIRERLKQQWSPEQIQGCRKINHERYFLKLKAQNVKEMF